MIGTNGEIGKSVLAVPFNEGDNFRGKKIERNTFIPVITVCTASSVFSLSAPGSPSYLTLLVFTAVVGFTLATGSICSSPSPFYVSGAPGTDETPVAEFTSASAVNVAAALLPARPLLGVFLHKFSVSHHQASLVGTHKAAVVVG